jgi:hypothetical protein
MHSFFNSIYRPFVWIVILLFNIIYPMLISVYVFLPLFIGIMGYFFIRGIAEAKVQYLFVPIVYVTNLEVNLSLPLFLMIISFLLVYMLFYQNLTYFRRCQICKPILSVILIDVFYLGMLLAYDFVFQTSSVVLDNLLLYSLIVDMLVVVIL